MNEHGRYALPSENRFWTTKDLGVGLQNFRYTKEIQFPDHSHSQSSIVICLGGSLECRQFGCRETLNPGDVVITNRNVPHASQYSRGGGISQGLTLDLNPDTAAQLNVAGRIYMGKLNLPQVARMANELLAEIEHKSLGYEYMMNGLTHQILFTVLRQWPADLVLQRQDATAEYLPRTHFVSAVEKMQREASTAAQPAILAEEFGYTTHRFEELFRQTTRRSIDEFREALGRREY